jgi:predicted Zn-dependent protease
MIAALALGVASCQPDDAALGREAAAEMDRQVRPVADATAQDELKRFGTILLEAVPPQSYAWRFRLIREPSVNAFALPGGYVYVHTGLMKAAQSADELAGVLGHEIAHAVLHHGAKQAQKREIGQVLIVGFCLITRLCDGGLGSVAVQVGESAVYSKFSRTAELQADSAGALYAQRAGFDPHAIARFFKRLEGERGSDPGVLKFFASHPMEATRIARIEKLIGPAATKSAPDSVIRLFVDLKRRSGGVARRLRDTTSF